MRSFSTNVQNALAQNDIRVFYLMKLEFNSTYHFTTHNKDITYAGQVFSAANGVIGLDRPSNNNVLDRSPFSMQFADLSQEMYSEFVSGVVGKDISVWVGFFDSNNQPLTALEDVLLIYKGTADNPVVNNDFDEVVASIEASSPMSDLDAVNSIWVSRDGMDQFSTTDTAFDEIYQNREVEVKWGKE